MNLKDILHIKFTENWELNITIGIFMWILITVVVLSLFWWRKTKIIDRWEPVEIEVPFGGGKIKITPNYEVVKIAHQAWTEIITRKAGLEFNEEDDVIVEIYNSWYELFKEIRLLIKNIPAQKLYESGDAQQLAIILVNVLNGGLRPHLTRWQASFRHWYLLEVDRHKDKSPQEIQRNYPEYYALSNDLKRVNAQMVDFAQELRKIVYPLK